MEGADTSIASASLRIDSGGNLRGESPDLPQFLSSIGGPIRSFADDEGESESEVAAGSGMAEVELA